MTDATPTNGYDRGEAVFIVKKANGDTEAYFASDVPPNSENEVMAVLSLELFQAIKLSGGP